ncbi:MAG: transglutaminase domain-containing protein [Anaerolineae bacterium]|nr:transglutaminase domain-containing protein [Anaerolineae bacterium]
MASEISAKWRGRYPSAGISEVKAENVGGWTTAAILSLLLLNFGWSISAAGWAEGLGILQWVLLGGVVVGILMALSRFDGVIPVLYSLATGSAWTLYWVSTLIQGEFTAQQRVYEVFTRWAAWFDTVIAGGTSGDNLIFVLELAFLGWWLAFLSGWAVFREQKVWRVVTPLGIAMIINVYYSARGLIGFLLLYFLLSLLLIIRVNLGQYESWWRSADIRYSPEVRFDLLRHGVTFSLVVVIAAWALPNVHTDQWLRQLMQPVERPWSNVQEEWQRLFTSLNYQAAAPAPAGFSRVLTLSGNRKVSDTIVMEIRAKGLDRWYWRGIAYDTYTGRGWVNTDQENIPIAPARPPELPSYLLRKVVTQTVTTYAPESDLLFAAALPAGSSVPARALASLLPPNPIEPNLAPYPEESTGVQPVRPVDISMMISKEPIRQGERYTTRSLASVVDVESLRHAGDAYPDYIKERYLQLPETLPEQVRALAEEITAGYDTAYDKAVALETYLRQIEYDEHIPPPPAGVDGVAYFLFDVKAGYCDYYASAMAVMARAVGIPARVVSGYAEGQWIEKYQIYRVRERDAHTWVEIYFPRYGWITFEPTASQPPIERPERPMGSRENKKRAPSLTNSNRPEMLDEELGRLRGRGNIPSPPSVSARWSTTQIAVMLVVIVAVVVVIGLLWRRKGGSRATHVAVSVYGRLLRWVPRLGVISSPSHTPYEQAAILAVAVPNGRPLILRIVEIYVRDAFGPRPLTVEEQRDVRRSWRKLRPKLWRQWVRVKFHRTR